MFLFPQDTAVAENVSILKEVATCDDFWVKVHAIEYLVSLGYSNEARELLDRELMPFNAISEKRIGVWRIKYKVAPTESAAEVWLNKIKEAYLDQGGKDRIHAAETLAKLGCSFKQFDQKMIAGDLRTDGLLSAFVLWGNTIPTSENKIPELGLLLKQLKDPNVTNRKLAAYALVFFKRLPLSDWEVLADCALKESPKSEAYAYLLSATYTLYDVHGNKYKSTFKVIRKLLLLLEKGERKSDRIQLCEALAVHATSSDKLILQRMLQLQQPIVKLPDYEGNVRAHPWNLDVKAAAAYALIRLSRTKISSIDNL